MWFRGNRKKFAKSEVIRTIARMARLAVLPCFLVVLLVLVSFLLIQGYEKINSSEYFLLKNIVIQGDTDLTRDEIIASCGLHLGQDKTLFLKTDKIQAMCERHPRIRTARVEIDLPDTINLKIQVHKIVFYVANQFGLFEINQFREFVRPVPPDEIEPLPVLVLDNKVMPEDVGYATSGMLKILGLVRGQGISWNEDPLTVEFTRARGFTLVSRFKAHLGYPPLDNKISRVFRILEFASTESLPIEEIYIAQTPKADRATVRFSQQANLLVQEKGKRITASKEGL
jgi:hypothetical protein